MINYNYVIGIIKCIEPIRDVLSSFIVDNHGKLKDKQYVRILTTMELLDDLRNILEMVVYDDE